MDPKIILCFELQELYESQIKHVEITPYRNELETMRRIIDATPEKSRKFIKDSSLLWLKKLEVKESREFRCKDSSERVKNAIDLRQRGNALFTSKDNRRSVLGACRLYTDAIYTALDASRDEIALGFANRAAALQTFGYYQQAYDDCVIALDLGYPKLLRHKIIMRQAYCSIKMKKLETAETHLKQLQELTLNEGFSKQLRELLVDFERVKKTSAVKINSNEKLEMIQHDRESQEVITTKNGRCMQAKRLIQENELIFTERASAFVAIDDTCTMCHECGTVNFIPIPCLNCRGRVNYCSLACQKKHAAIHMFECRAYRMQLFSYVGIVHLALRIILDNGIFSIVNDLKMKNVSSPSEVWYQLTKADDICKNNKKYFESLRMITHMDKMDYLEILHFALTSNLMVVYLKRYTTYFQILNDTCKTIDWELLTGSLILRHIGQAISNSHVLSTIVPPPLIEKRFHMLNEEIWSSPWHLRLGCLHLFSNCDQVASLNLPYLSICNHSCIQQFETKYSGRYISTYALRKIQKGKEITNCYYPDHRKEQGETRRQKLLDTYFFECRCENCLQTNSEDIPFNQFYKYRCDNNKCGKIFTSSIPEVNTLIFGEIELSHYDPMLFCTVCGYKQKLKWYHEVKDLLPLFTIPKTRHRLYQIFKETEQHLIGLNLARWYLAKTLLYKWFSMFWEEPYFSLNNQDFCNIIEVIKFILTVITNRSSVNSTEYVAYITYMWDIMAYRKHKCSKEEMDQMLSTLNIISDDLKVIFLNYYNDYIKRFLNF